MKISQFLPREDGILVITTEGQVLQFSKECFNDSVYIICDDRWEKVLSPQPDTYVKASARF